MKNPERWKEIQHSMAIEGFSMSDEMLSEVAATYEAERGDEEVEEVFKRLTHPWTYEQFKSVYLEVRAEWTAMLELEGIKRR